MGRDVENLKRHLKFKEKLLKTASGTIALGLLAGTLASCREENFFEPVDIEYSTPIVSPIDPNETKPEVVKREPEEIRVTEPVLTPPGDTTKRQEPKSAETTEPAYAPFDPFKYNNAYSQLKPKEKLDAFAYNFYDINDYIKKVYLSLELDLAKQEYFTNVTFEYNKQITKGLEATQDLYYFCEKYLHNSNNNTFTIDMADNSSLNNYLCENIFRVLKNTYKNQNQESISKSKPTISETEMTNIQKLDKFFAEFGASNVEGFDTSKDNLIAKISVKKMYGDNGEMSASVTLYTRGDRNKIRDNKGNVSFDYSLNKISFVVPYSLLETLNKVLNKEDLTQDIELSRTPKNAGRIDKISQVLTNYFNYRYSENEISQ